MSSVVLISVLIYQSAAFVFLDGSRVNEGLVRVMVIWLSICLSLAQLFLLRPLMTVVVHSFVADSSLLDCCDLVVCFCVVFFHLMLAGRQPFGILRWFQLFVSFIWCQLFACLIRAANFRLLPAFVVWSFFLCHRHLWSVLSFFATGIGVQSLFFTAFSAVGIRVRLFVFALLALVSGFRL